MTAYDTDPGLPDPETAPELYDGTVVKRGLAWVVDVVLIALLTAVVIPFTAFTALFFLPALWFVLSFLYRWVTLANGSATWGMRLFSVEIRDRYGDPLDTGTALLHTAGYATSIAVFPLQLVSVAMMFLTDRGQGLTDMVLGTVALNRRF